MEKKGETISPLHLLREKGRNVRKKKEQKQKIQKILVSGLPHVYGHYIYPLAFLRRVCQNVQKPQKPVQFLKILPFYRCIYLNFAGSDIDSKLVQS